MLNLDLKEERKTGTKKTKGKNDKNNKKKNREKTRTKKKREKKTDNEMEIYSNEILVDVIALNIDSASFTQMTGHNKKQMGKDKGK